MTRRDFAKQSAALAAMAPSRKPNLLFVFSDQQSADMLGCYGNRQIVTPRLDDFARQSVLFRHCISNSPLCTPYRGMLLSGRHPLHNGAMENDVRMLPDGRSHFGERLRDAGYRIGYVGKWHLYGGDRVRPIPPGLNRYGFDHTFLSNNCTVMFDAARTYYWNEKGEKTLYGDWEPYAQARQAMRFIDENADKPFALFVSWHPPHNWSSGHPARGPEDGYGAPEDLLKLYDPAALQLRPNCADTASARKLYQGYMAMCTSVDRAFGWLMDKLAEKGIAQDTIVVFTSDHGDTALSHGLRGNKMRPEIESIRVPLLMRYPKRLKARESQLLIGGLDMMPTLLGLLDLLVPSTCQGKNLAPAIERARDNEVESVPLFLPPLDWRGLYTRRFTYSFDTGAGTQSWYRRQFFSNPPGIQWNCLWDRDADPAEKQNLYGSTDHARSRRHLHDLSIDWMKRFQDRGWSYQTITEAVFTPEDRELLRERKGYNFSGVLKGRPVELLADAGPKVL